MSVSPTPIFFKLSLISGAIISSIFRNMGIARLDQTQACLVQYHLCESGQHQMPLEEERTLL